MTRETLIPLAIFPGLLFFVMALGAAQPPADIAAAPLGATTTTIATGFGSPDDLAIMPSGDILFGDFSNKSLNILRPGSSPVALATGFTEPEGIVVTKDGAIIVAEQKNNSLVEVNPTTGAKKTLRVIKNTTGKDGIDGLGLDPFTGDILVPDSPHGTLLRMSRDGSKLTTIATGFVRPTGAAVEANGSILVADEFGNVVYRLSKTGRRTFVAHIYQPDDVVVGPSGTIYVNCLNGNIWAINPKTLVRRVLVSGLKLPHGLGVDKNGLVLAEAGRNRILRVPLANP
jgi:sugar lactone lactonase YvrE